MTKRIFNNFSIYLRFESFPKSFMLSKFRAGKHSVILLISCETILQTVHAVSKGSFSHSHCSQWWSYSIWYSPKSLFASSSIRYSFLFLQCKGTHTFTGSFPSTWLFFLLLPLSAVRQNLKALSKKSRLKIIYSYTHKCTHEHLHSIFFFSGVLTSSDLTLFS